MAGVVAVRRPVEAAVALPLGVAKLRLTVPVVPSGGSPVDGLLEAAAAAEVEIVVVDPFG